MSRPFHLSRRTFLGGAGVLLSLPLLEQMRRVARGASAGPKPAVGDGVVRNFVVWHFPTSWTNRVGALIADGATTGALTAASIGPVLKSLETDGLLGDTIIPTNIRNQPAYASQAGDHARGVGALLTCQQPQTGDTINVGPSLDHVVAAKISQGARIPSLQLGTNNNQPTGSCDSGYPCPNQFNASFSAPGVVAPREIDPGKAFRRMFDGFDPGASEAEALRRQRYRTSVLDYTLEQTSTLKTKLNPRDNAKLDQYFTGLREFEERLANAGAPLSCTPGDDPGGTPSDVRDKIRLMNDLTVLALQCQSSPVVFFAYENTVSSAQHTFLTTADGQTVVDDWHIGLTHYYEHANPEFRLAELEAVNTWLVSQYTDVAKKLKAIEMPEGGTLLDHTIMLGVSDMGDEAHNHERMRPIIIGGSALGLSTGRLLVNGAKIPLANVYMGVLEALGVEQASFGDSNGTFSLS